MYHLITATRIHGNVSTIRHFVVHFEFHNGQPVQESSRLRRYDVNWRLLKVVDPEVCDQDVADWEAVDPEEVKRRVDRIPSTKQSGPGTWPHACQPTDCCDQHPQYTMLKHIVKLRLAHKLPDPGTVCGHVMYLYEEEYRCALDPDWDLVDEDEVSHRVRLETDDPYKWGSQTLGSYDPYYRAMKQIVY